MVRRPLFFQVGVVIVLLAGVGLVGFAISLYLVQKIELKVSAVNQAGSLRKQSYLIAARLMEYNRGSGNTTRLREALDTFNRRLSAEPLETVVHRHSTGELVADYSRIADSWKKQVQPGLVAFANKAGANDYFNLGPIDSFVAEIDSFVLLLEKSAERDLHHLQIIQAGSLLAIVIALTFIMLVTARNIRQPLLQLLRMAGKVRAGDFSVRASHVGSDELGRLGETFNLMATELSRRYASLESRVAEKTAALERSSASLDLLYQTIQMLNEYPLSNTAFRVIYNRLSTLVPVTDGVIRLRESTRSDKSSCNLLSSERDHFCRTNGCDAATGEPENADCKLESLSYGIVLRDQEHRYGILLLRVRPGFVFEHWHIHLFEAIGRHIGMAIGARQRIVDQRISLHEERATIARELHDSLAQSLSFLKIQVSRLHAQMNKDPDLRLMRPIVSELRDGLSDAYAQLRQLLSTFRIQIDQSGLGQALTDTINEFSRRGNLSISLDTHSMDGKLDASEEIHVLQIVREALSNVVRHAQSSHVDIILTESREQGFEALIRDNGIGMQTESAYEQRYGLSIMRERARSLGGSLQILSAPDTGTCVKLNFVPRGHPADSIPSGEASL